MTVSEAFEKFKGHLELPAYQRQRASEAQQELRGYIGAHLAVYDSFLTGSYARHTKIHPLNDIDVMLVRNSARVGLTGSGGVFPHQALDDVAEAANRAFGNGVVVKKQSRSVNLSFATLDFGFDLIPAWLRQPNGFWIPDIDTASWIQTDPQVHEEMMSESNERCQGKLKPIIKMIKHWSRNNLDLLCSFHLELICDRVFRQSSPDNYQTGVALVLVNLPSFVGIQMMDPVYVLNRVDNPLSADEFQKLSNRANYDAGNARKAFQLECSGSHAAAIETWKHIFLTGFPNG